jgi:hypothetical protein
MSTDTSDSWTPTRTSTAIALAVSLGAVALLLQQVRPVAWPALIGSAGAVAFAASLWLAGRDRWSGASAFAVSLLTLPVAAGIIVGTVGTVLLLVSAFFPVQTTAQLSVRSLLLLAHVGVVAGAVFAVFGVALGVRNVVDADVLERQYWVTIKTGVVPAAAGMTMVLGTFLVRSEGVTPGNERAFDSLVDGLLSWLLAPGGNAIHLATFLLLVAVAAAGVRAAIRALPIAELLADTGTGETSERRVATVRDALAMIMIIAGLGGVLAFTLELAVPPARLRQVLGVAILRPVYAISTASGLRVLLVGLIALSVPTVLAVILLRRVARGSARSALRRVAPLAGGTVLTAAGVVFAPPLLAGLVSWIERKLPDVFAELFRTTADATIQFYGAPAIVVLMIGALVALTAAVVILFRFALYLGYLSSETAGYSLASGGLFAAAAFAGVIEAPTWLVFTGLVASLLVWDMGRYGTRLGREIGRRAPTRNAELVHAGGTLAVGILGAVAAVAVRNALTGWSVSSDPAATGALVGVLAGIVLLVTALR